LPLESSRGANNGLLMLFFGCVCVRVAWFELRRLLTGQTKPLRAWLSRSLIKSGILSAAPGTSAQRTGPLLN